MNNNEVVRYLQTYDALLKVGDSTGGLKNAWGNLVVLSMGESQSSIS
jgi:hypothetical protein